MRVMAVVQLGFAMIPLCHRTSSALISGTTRGTASSIRNALELSTTTHPAWAARGANSREMAPPALNRAISIPLNEFLVNSLTSIAAPRKLNVLPTDRDEASKVSLPTGKPRFSRVLIISRPTAPVAPTTATCGFLFIGGVTIPMGEGVSNGGFGPMGKPASGNGAETADDPAGNHAQSRAAGSQAMTTCSADGLIAAMSAHFRLKVHL